MKHLLASLLVALFLVACDQASNNNPQPNPSSDKEAPIVTLAASATTFRSPGTLTLTATASDNIGVSKVEFFEEDVNVSNLQATGLKTTGLEPLAENKISEDSEAPFTLEFPISNGDNIVRTFRAKALDEAGNVGSSLAVTVDIDIELGSLSVSVFSPNSGFAFEVDIVVTGPNGFEKRLKLPNSANNFLNDLEFGSYTITPSSAVGANAVVNGILEADSETVELSPENTFDSATMTYRLRPDTGKLWLPVRDERKLIALAPENLSANLPANPAIAVGTGAASAPNAIAFDAAGNLWLTERISDNILMFTSEQLATSGTPTPTVTLDGTGFLDGPVGLAFDLEDNLWVASSFTNTVLRYTANELTASGAPIPDILSRPSILKPFGLAFDEAGNLWISNRDAGTVTMFPKADLDFLSNIPAAVTLTTGSLPEGLAFDKDGNLWVANLGSDSVMRFPVQGLSSGTVAPDIILTNNNGSLDSPTGLAFDNTGKLYVSNVLAKTLAIFETSALVASGSPTAKLISGLGDTDVAFMAFNLPPENLPLSR